MLGTPQAVPTEEAGDRPDKPGVPEQIIQSATWDGWPLEEGKDSNTTKRYGSSGSKKYRLKELQILFQSHDIARRHNGQP